MANWLTDHDYVTRQSWPRSGRSFSSSGPQKRSFRIVCVHSTETVGFPGYRGGASNPHVTQSLVSGNARQHVPFNHGARALMIGGDRMQNVGGVIQFEFIGAVTPGYPGKYGHYDLPNDFPDDEQAQFWMARLIADTIVATGNVIPAKESVDWLSYPASSGKYSGVRLSQSQRQNYRGVLAHQHMDSNTHGDAGALPMGSVVLPLVLKMLKKPTGRRGRSGSVFFLGAQGSDVGRWQSDLVKAGYDIGPDGVDDVFGRDTGKATWRFQRDNNLERDKRVGPNTKKAMARVLEAGRGWSGSVFFLGAQGPVVKQWQRDLMKAGYDIGPDGADGSFGSDTGAGTSKFQRDNNLERDKRVGPNTLAAMASVLEAIKNKPDPPDKPDPAKMGRNGDVFYLQSRGPDVLAWQEALTRVGISVGSYGSDGVFGPGTQEGTETFESLVGHKVNGTVAPSLLKEMQNVVEALEKNRISGDTRYGTAVAISQEAFPDGADVVYLTSGDAIDGVAGSALLRIAGAQGPLLLVPRGADTVPDGVLAEIIRLAPGVVKAIGGANTVTDAQLFASRDAAGLIPAEDTETS